ncbi:MAG: bifunctional UDP-N-acetylmuramoyl-tripeptide:D-alanyl-D-alanine ligase/alanine racemase [Bacteroidota bacterium]
MLFSELAAIVPGSRAVVPNDDHITLLITDSRNITPLPQSVFLAIKGNNHDGHSFLKEVYQSGVRQFIVENEDYSLPEDCNALIVRSTILAIQKIVAKHRSLFNFPVVGITGSNGKTIAKEWLSTLLQGQYNVVKSPKSYNSQIGVPLSVWRMSDQHSIGVFEAGISKKGEMSRLAEVIDPDIGIFTNIGSAHADGFNDQEEKIREKLLLFQKCKTLIYCNDHEAVATAVESEIDSEKISWSFSKESDFNIKFSKGILSLESKSGKVYEFKPKFTDRSSLENLIHCLVCCLHLGIDPHSLNDSIDRIEGVQMRLTIKAATNGCYLIDDSYNNDLSALEVATDFLIRQNQRKKKTIILSDILQSGMLDETLYEKVASLISERPIDRLIGIGERITRLADQLPIETVFYKNADELLQSDISFNNEMILIKGARRFQLEKIVQFLEQKVHRTVLEVNMEALAYNLNFFKQKLHKSTKLMVMVKALAYGGSYEIANLLQYHGVDYLGVAYADEGVKLRQNGITLPIMVLNVTDNAFDVLERYQLEPEIYSLAQLERFIAHFEGRKSPAIHLKIETGMNRLGFAKEEITLLINLLKANGNNLQVAGIFTHLASADNPSDNDYSRKQLTLFTELSDLIIETLGYQPLRHALNTAGISSFPDYQLEMVRLGIGLYGYDALFSKDLKVVSSLKTTISQIKRVKQGESVGYGRSYKVESEMTIATIAIGYADGFRRSLSNGVGKVSIRNHLVPVVGRVCMDMTMVDVSEIDASVGDEVVVFGNHPGIEMLADWMDTIPYEILTNVGDRVKRIFISE